MVRLDRIYTGGGDRGETSLGDGARVAKHGVRIHAIGEVDEANATIGLARAALGQSAAPFDAALARVQNDLFDLGADLAVPGADAATDDDGKLRIQGAQAARLESEIDGFNRDLAPLTSFVLPAGTEAAARLHLARTVTRRAERAVAALAAAEKVNPCLLVFLNRLSDLLFVMARAANDGGAADVTWRPGGTRTGKTDA
ncbi:MAG: cob(I)yrinic acid a,c-diamide adenosyltransferase [Alphaproteobacteria bacterium]